MHGKRLLRPAEGTERNSVPETDEDVDSALEHLMKVHRSLAGANEGQRRTIKDQQEIISELLRKVSECEARCEERVRKQETRHASETKTLWQLHAEQVKEAKEERVFWNKMARDVVMVLVGLLGGVVAGALGIKLIGG